MSAGRAPRVALVTCREALTVDEDLPPLHDALTALGAQVSLPAWDEPEVAWAQFDLAVLRSTWDYAERIDEFLAWVTRCASLTQLLNPPRLVRWNTDKRYLRELARAGVPVVPTRFVAPGADAAAELERFLAGGTGSLSVGDAERFADFVVKPSVGAASRDAARYRRADRSQAQAHLARLTGEGRHAMLQPYLERVDQSGETALMYFDGEFSHSLRKGPILRAGAGFVAGLFAAESITARPADDDERRVAEAACRAIPGSAPVFARVDLVRGDDGLPVLLELELTEPSLYFQHAPGSAQRLARALLARCTFPD
jgi:hypothetical protein